LGCGWAIYKNDSLDGRNIKSNTINQNALIYFFATGDPLSFDSSLQASIKKQKHTTVNNTFKGKIISAI
jgi:hypothetical protein